MPVERNEPGLRRKRQAGQAAMDHAGSLVEKGCGGRSGNQGRLERRRVRKWGERVVMNIGDRGSGGEWRARA